MKIRLFISRRTKIVPNNYGHTIYCDMQLNITQYIVLVETRGVYNVIAHHSNICKY